MNNKNNFKSSCGQNSLIHAIKNHKIKLAERLLELNVDPNICDAKGRAPLIYAIKNRNWILVKKLLKHGANPNIRDNKGMSPLMYASVYFDSSILRSLLAHDANPNAQDNEGKTSLMHALINELRDKLSVGRKPNLSSSALIATCLFKALHSEKVGKFVDIRDNNGKTALMYAIEAESNMYIDLLKTANLNILDNSNKTALIYAIESKNCVIIDQILYHIRLRKFNSSYRSKKNNVWKLALESAIHSKNFDILNKLLYFLYIENSNKPECFDAFIKDLTKLTSQDLLSIMSYHSRFYNNTHNEKLVRAILAKNRELHTHNELIYPDLSFANLEDQTSWLESSINNWKSKEISPKDSPKVSSAIAIRQPYCNDATEIPSSLSISTEIINGTYSEAEELDNSISEEDLSFEIIKPLDKNVEIVEQNNFMSENEYSYKLTKQDSNIDENSSCDIWEESNDVKSKLLPNNIPLEDISTKGMCIIL